MKKGRRALHPQLTLWLENSAGEPAFGKGRMVILDAVDAHGSLSAAARALGMSYRGLWARLRRSERRLGYPLVVSHPGCGRDSGSALTPEGRALLERYRELLCRVKVAADDAAREILGCPPQDRAPA
jgi:molybdate transport system regulatory protein